MVNVDGSKRIWKQPEIKDIFEKCGAKKPAITLPRSSSRPLEASCSRKLLKEPVEERISVLLKDRKKKVVSIFYIILIMVVCKAVIL